MERTYMVVYTRTVMYAPIEILADSEDEALEIVREMANKGELYEDDCEDYNIDIEEIGYAE